MKNSSHPTQLLFGLGHLQTLLSQQRNSISAELFSAIFPAFCQSQKSLLKVSKKKLEEKGGKNWKKVDILWPHHLRYKWLISQCLSKECSPCVLVANDRKRTVEPWKVLKYLISVHIKNPFYMTCIKVHFYVVKMMVNNQLNVLILLKIGLEEIKKL